MNHPVLKLSNSSNWESVWQGTFSAQRSSGNTIINPIPEIVVPILLDKHILAVSITSSTAKPTWYFGGFLNQRISLGIVVGGLPDSDAIEKRRIWLNRLTLITLTQLTSHYAVSFNVPKWFQDVQLHLWQYVGPESDSTEDLISEISVQLQRIENKVNNLRTNN